MGSVYAIEGYTGPGRRTKLFETDVNEIGFNFKKKILSVVTRDGNYGTYDMVPMTAFEFTSDGEEYVVVVKSKKEFDKEEDLKREHEAESKEVRAKVKELIDQHDKEVQEARDHDGKQATDGTTKAANTEGKVGANTGAVSGTGQGSVHQGRK